MPDENEIVPQDATEIENFSLFPPRRVYVMNTPLPVEEVDKSTRKVIVENTTLSVEEVNTTARKVTVENTNPILVKVDENEKNPLLVYAAHQQWQYNILEMPTDPIVFAQKMDERGAVGYEIAATIGTRVIFKRPYLPEGIPV